MPLDTRRLGPGQGTWPELWTPLMSAATFARWSSCALLYKSDPPLAEQHQHDKRRHGPGEGAQQSHRAREKDEDCCTRLIELLRSFMHDLITRDRPLGGDSIIFCTKVIRSMLITDTGTVVLYGTGTLIFL